MSAIPFVPFENTIKLEGIFTQDAQRVENVHYYLVDETPSVDTCISLATAYRTWWNSDLRDQVPNTVSLVMIKCTIMETQFSPGIEFTENLPYVGIDTDAAMPNNVTVAIKWLTGLRGRSYRGRTYHVGLRDGLVTNNTVTTAGIAVLKAAYDNLITLQVDVGPAVMGIASKIQGGIPRTTGVITPVINCAIDATVDSQRRRLPGRGR